MGAPKNNTNNSVPPEKFRHVKSYRASDREFEKIEKLANKAGKSTGTYVRMKALGEI